MFLHAWPGMKLVTIRMHSSMMRTTHPLPYGGVSVRGSLFRDGSVHGGLCPGWSLSRGSLSREGDLCPGGLCPGGHCLGVSVRGSLSRGSLLGGLCPGRGSLSREGVSVQGCLCLGVSVQGGFCPERSLSRGVSVWGVSVQWSLCMGDLPDREPPRWRPPWTETKTHLWTDRHL